MANLQDIVNRSEVGAIKPWTKATAPDGYVLCNGAAISRTTYADLFGVIGTTYGAGDSSTTFNVPQLQGKMPQGYDGNTYNLAGTGGANTVTVAVTNNQAATNATNQTVSVTGSISNTSLTLAQVAAHSHGPSRNSLDLTPTGGSFPVQVGGNREFGVSPTDSQGSGTAHNHAHTLTGTLTGNITTSLTGTVTAAGTNSFSPFVVVNYIIKH
jgi:microcystin-dependent protein